MLTEPKNVTTRWTHPYGKILGYDVEVLEWTDDTFSLLVFTSGARYIDREYLIKDLTGDDNPPTDEDIELRIRETLSEEFDGVNYTYTVSYKNGKEQEVVLIVTARDDIAAIAQAMTMLHDTTTMNGAIVHAERVV